ncbi:MULTISPECIES: hypothetical protein [unclassified Actinotalea]|uniref:hypothetical protein n=1 Tax=unclassified Actinotalea TaxID=2638618 RepID=UPI0015F534EF|nr:MULTISPECIES: hypothetical protein [unclassified Actinotalea]
MQPGVDAVEAVPGMTTVLAVLLIAATCPLVLLGRAAIERAWRRAAAWAAATAVVVGLCALYVAPRYETWQRTWDYDATWARVEAHYGVRLSEEDKATTTLPRPPRGYSSGVVNQHELGPVTMPDGTVREDLFLQFAQARPARVAVVTQPEGANELVATVGGWWPEIPVVE